MTPWLIFGAGSGVGAELVTLGLREQRPLFALVRNPEQAQTLRDKGVQVIEGDALNAEKVEQVCRLAGEHARVVSTLGGREGDYQGNRFIIDTAEHCGITHMILVTSIGCGDSWPTLSERAKKAFGQAVREKSLAESWLQTSQLRHCILRPGGLFNGDSTGNAQCIQGEAHGLIRRADVALIIQKLIDDENSYGKTFALVDPMLKP